MIIACVNLMVCFQGEFFVEKESDTMVPFSPPLLPPLPTSGDSIGKMVFLWLTDYMANTAALVYMRLGTLSYSVTPELVKFPVSPSVFSFLQKSTPPHMWC